MARTDGSSRASPSGFALNASLLVCASNCLDCALHAQNKWSQQTVSKSRAARSAATMLQDVDKYTTSGMLMHDAGRTQNMAGVVILVWPSRTKARVWPMGHFLWIRSRCNVVQHTSLNENVPYNPRSVAIERVASPPTEVKHAMSTWNWNSETL